MSHQSAPVDRTRSQVGTSFIEVVTVVLVLAVLLTIAIPAFIGAKTRASDRDAQTSLRIALTNSKAIFADTDTFAKVTVATLHAAETSVAFTSGASTGPKEVSVDSSNSGVILTARSPSGTCYVIGDTGSTVGVVFGSLGPATCQASTVPALPLVTPTALHLSTGGGWAQGW